jgi:hypothetical protein
MKRILVSLSSVAANATSAAALACGVCVEDKVAATYDHAVITQAKAAHRQVVFVAIDGPYLTDVGRRIAAAAGHVRGVEKKTVRVSDSPAAFSFVVARSEQPERAVAGFRGALGDSGVRLTLVRVMRDGRLIDPNE